jgi:hypothetical protein
MKRRIRYVFPETVDFRETRPTLCWEHMYGWIDGYGLFFDPVVQSALGTLPEWENGWKGASRPEDFIVSCCRQATALVQVAEAPGLYVRPRETPGLLAAGLAAEKNVLETPLGRYYYPQGGSEPLRYDRYATGSSAWRLGEFPAVQAQEGRVALAFEFFGLLWAWNGDWPERRLVEGAEILRGLLAESGVWTWPPACTLNSSLMALRLDFQAYGVNRFFLQWFLEKRGQPREAVREADAHYEGAVKAWHRNDPAGAASGLARAFEQLAALRVSHSRLDIHFCECPHMGILLDRAGWFELEWPEQSRQHLESYLDHVARHGYRVSLEAGGNCWRNLQARFPELMSRLAGLWADKKIDLLNGTFSLPYTLLSPLLLQYWQMRVGHDAFRQVFGRVPDMYEAQENALSPQLPELLALFGYRGAMHIAQNRGSAPAEQQSRILWQSPAGCGVPAIAACDPGLARKGNNYFFDLPLIHDAYGSEAKSIDYLNPMDLGFIPFRVHMIRAHHYAPVWGAFALAGDRLAATAAEDMPARSYLADDYKISASFFYGNETDVNALSQYEAVFTRTAMHRQIQFMAWTAGRWPELRPALEAVLPELCLQEAHDVTVVQGQRRGEFHAGNAMDPPPYTRETLAVEIAARRETFTRALEAARRLLIPSGGAPLLFNAGGVQLPYARVSHPELFTGGDLLRWGEESLANGPFPAWQAAPATALSSTWTMSALPARCGPWSASRESDGALAFSLAERRITCIPTDSRFGRYVPVRTDVRQAGPFLAVDVLYMNRGAGVGTVEVSVLMHAESSHLDVRVRYAPGREFDVRDRWSDALSLEWSFGAPLERVLRFNPNVESVTREDRVTSPCYLAAESVGGRTAFFNEGAFVYELDRPAGRVRLYIHVAGESAWTRRMGVAFDPPNALELARAWGVGVVPAAAAKRTWPLQEAAAQHVSAETFIDDDTLLISNLRASPVSFALGGAGLSLHNTRGESRSTVRNQSGVGTLEAFELGLLKGLGAAAAT